jgi:hypothetical protein
MYKSNTYILRLVVENGRVILDPRDDADYDEASPPPDHGSHRPQPYPAGLLGKSLATHARKIEVIAGSLVALCSLILISWSIRICL